MIKQSQNNFTKWVLIILTSIFIIIGILSCFISISNAIPPNGNNKFLQTICNISKLNFSDLSDGFAGLSWSVIGVFLLCLTLYYQRRDFKNSEITNNKQRFETTFFNMLSMLIQIRNSISCKSGGTEKNIDGYHYLSNCVRQLKNEYTNLLKENDDLKEIESKISRNEVLITVEREGLKTVAQNLYENFYKNNHAYLGHYFRYIYHIVEFTIREREQCGDVELYLSIIQSQLSDDELSLLFYNCLSNYAKKKETSEPRFYKNMDKYGLLENVDADSLLSRNHHILYPHTYFKFLNTDEKDIRHKYL